MQNSEQSKGLEAATIYVSEHEAAATLDTIRRKLLDLSLRNKLLNTPILSKSSKQFLKFAGVDSNKIIRDLEDGKDISFACVPDPEPEQALRFGFQNEGPKAEQWAEILGIPCWLEPQEKDKKTTEKTSDLFSLLNKEITELSAAGTSSLSRALEEVLRKDHWELTKVNQVLAYEGYKDLKGYLQNFRRNGKARIPSPKAGPLPERHLRAILYQKALDGYLKNIYRTYRGGVEELGIGTLYLIFGFLEWREADSSSKSYYAPLVTYPVEMSSKRSRKAGVLYEYTISAANEEPQQNLSLEEKLKTDYNVSLPQRRTDEDGSLEDLEKYFDRVEKAVSLKKDWKLHRYVVLGNLEFSKLMMYRDLVPESWPGGIQSFFDSPLLSFLFKVKTQSCSDVLGEDYHIDKIEDLETNVPLIDKADSSQHSALIDVLSKDRNLVIEGPPGTGKSQTITNLIAGALHKGKTVLFVSEKTAALDVVKRRLEAAGLGAFCLSIQQAASANKHQIFDDLKVRVDLKLPHTNPRQFENLVSGYRNYRDILNKYADRINTSWGGTGKTIHEIFAAQVRYQGGVPPEERRAVIPQVSGESFTPYKQEEYKENISLILDITETLRKESGENSITKCAWFGVYTEDAISNRKSDELLRSLRCWQENLSSRKALLTSLANSLGFADKRLACLEQMFQEIPRLEEKADFSEAVRILKEHGTFSEGDVYFSTLEKIHQGYSKLGTKVKPELLSDILEGKTFDFPTLQSIGLNKEKADHSIEDLFEVLKTIRSGIEKVGTLENLLVHLRASLPKSIASRMTPNTSGYAFLLRWLQITESIRTDLIAHRAPFFDDISADEELRRIEKQLAWLQQTEEELSSVFSIEKALEVEDLAEIEGQIKNSGFFSFLSSSYRNAKAKLLSISVDPKGNAKEFARHLEKLREFQTRNKELGDCYGYREKFGNLFEGRRTNFKDIQALRDWYKRIRSEWGIGFGPNVGVGNDLIALSSTLLGSIKSQSSDLKSTTTQILDSISDLRTFFPESSHEIDKGWESDANALLAFCDRVERRLSQIISCVLSGKLTAEDILEAAVETEDLRRSIESARKTEESFGFTSNIQSAAKEGTASEQAEKLKATLFLTQRLSEMENKTLQKNVLALRNREEFKAITDRLSQLEKNRNDEDNVKQAFIKLGQVDLNDWLRRYDSEDFESVIERNEFSLSHPDELKTWSRYMHHRSVVAPLGILPMWDRLLRGEIPSGQFSDYVYNAIYNVLSEEIAEKCKDILVSTGTGSEKNCSIFRDKDEKLTEFNRRFIAQELMKRQPPAGTQGSKVSSFTQMCLVRHEINKKKQHLPLRQLFRRAGEAIMEIKPCWMMSPLAVAKFLEPGHLKFDLIVMDEASQIRPEDALGTLLRGDKAVIVGDPKQLPPTSFFQKTGYGTMDSDEEEPDERSILGENESILDTMSNWLPKRMLHWHYRSRHESLIAFSNEHFYDSKLIIFPSPTISSDDLGLRFTYIPDGEFDKGINRHEAEKVVDAIIDHARRYPNESLAVVTMNAGQQTLIEELLETRLVNRPSEKELMDKLYNMADPFIIKNLENIQGDERDVVFISCTYGKAPGTNVVPQRFGPINRADGWRRLNVLFTRARKRMHVFSSMQGTDIHPQESSTSFESLSALRGFIETASEHNAGRGEPQGAREPDSDFEIAVADKLREFGFECHYQVGAAGYFIDIAVLDPHDQNRYLMAIECDGASYHSAKSARDRDALRQQILENLGWRVRRIWSADWFSNAEGALKPIVEELEQLAAASTSRKPTRVQFRPNQVSSVEIIEPQNTPKNEHPESVDPVEEKLLALKEEIDLHYPDVPYARKLLRPEIMKILVEESPTTIEEYHDAVPHYLIVGSDPEQAREYTSKIIETIRACVKGKK